MKVLIVSPRFAPSNAADSHRVRLLLPYFAQLGWQAEVLAVDWRDVPCAVDPWLEQRVPDEVPIHCVRAWRLGGWGLNGLAQRSAWPLWRYGCELLERGDFDLVFFSTTEFLLHALGPLWQRRFGVPFCMDYQDPWVSDYYREHPSVIPPGGRLKFGVMDRVDRFAEACVVPRCAGFLSVSAPYLDALDRRYGQLVAQQPRLIQVFPGEPDEFAALPAATSAQDAPANGPRVIRYVGRGGADMAWSARAFLVAWRSLIDEGLLSPQALRFEAIGTSYAASDSGQRTFVPVAQALGLSKYVSESPGRLPYGEVLTTLRSSDALVVFGSDDASYTASKIYPFLLARRPLLAIFHRDSSVVGLIGEVGGARCATFSSGDSVESPAAEIRAFLLGVAAGDAAVELSEQRFEAYTAHAQAIRVTDWFSRVVERHTESKPSQESKQ
jgi:hypothetical protein